MRSIIYETNGRAREYSELALNLFSGCGHHCIYCYSPDVLHIDRAIFYGDVRPRVTVAEIAASARKFEAKGETRAILLSFTGDPYQSAEAETQLTRQAITVLHAHGLKVTILTKGGKRALRDFDLLGPGDQFAVTLTCIDEETSRWWEPGATLPMERIESLIEAHIRGIKTWVSLEPVIYPKATKQLVMLTKDFVGHYKVGTLNYHPWAANIDWAQFVHQITECMDTLGVRYYIKKDLARYLGKSEGFWSAQRG
ncbi:MAG: radical SAM protein [Chloroflexota bacterium]